MVRVVAVAFLCFCLLGIAGACAQNPTEPDVRLNIPYGSDPAQQLDLCLPAGGNAGGVHPAVVMIHGGYWTMGDKSWYAGLCKMAASQGIVAASIGYRLGNDSPHNRWPAQLVDAQLAVRWLRAHAGEFAVDPAKICALGDSAGAHLAVFVAALDHTFPGDDAGELPHVSSRVACAVDNFGPVDLSVATFWPPGPQLFGVKQGERAPDQEAAASPLFLIGPKTAPMMIVHGRDDKSVNVAQSQELYARLQQAHVAARLVLLNCGHEFAGLPVPDMMKVFQDELDFIKHPSAGS